MTGSFPVMVTTLFFESREPLLPPLPLAIKASFRRQASAKAAIYDYGRARHEGSIIAGKKHGRARDLAGLANAAEGVEQSCLFARRGRVLLRFEIALCQAGINISGANCMYANAFAPMIDGHRFRQSKDRSFGGTIARACRLNEECVHGRKIDNDSARLSQSRHEYARKEKDPRDSPPPHA